MRNTTILYFLLCILAILFEQFACNKTTEEQNQSESTEQSSNEPSIDYDTIPEMDEITEQYLNLLPEWSEIIIKIDFEQAFHNPFVEGELSFDDIELSSVLDTNKWQEINFQLGIVAQFFNQLGINPAEDMDMLIMGIGNTGNTIFTQEQNPWIIGHLILTFDEEKLLNFLSDQFNILQTTVNEIPAFDLSGIGLDLVLLPDSHNNRITFTTSDKAMDAVNLLISNDSIKIDTESEFYNRTHQFLREYSTLSILVNLEKTDIYQLLSNSSEGYYALQEKIDSVLEPLGEQSGALFPNYSQALGMAESIRYAGFGLFISDIVKSEFVAAIDDEQKQNLYSSYSIAGLAYLKGEYALNINNILESDEDKEFAAKVISGLETLKDGNALSIFRFRASSADIITLIEKISE